MKITCPECAETFSVSADMIGKKAKCGECAHVFVVPGLTEAKTGKGIEAKHDTNDREVRHAAWLSLYLAGMAVLLLLFRGQQGSMIASLLLALATEGAALFLTWRGLKTAIPLEPGHDVLVRTAILVNSIVLALLALSFLLTLYMLVSGSSGGGLGGGAGDIMKYFNEIQKNLPK